MANASSIKAGSAYVELLLSDSRFVKGLARAAAKLRAFGTGVSGIGRRLSVAAGSILSALTGTSALFSAVGDSLAKMSGRTGISVEALSELAYAAELSGTDVQTLENSIRRMQKTLVDAANGSSGAVETLRELGLTVGDLAGMSPDEQFKRIADRLARVQSPAMRAALAMKIFGKSGAQLLPLMQDGAAGIEALQEEARRLGLTMSTEDARSAEELNDTMDRLWKVLQRGVFIVGSALAPTVSALTKRVTDAIVAANAWIAANRELVVSVFKIVGAVLAIGLVLVGLGAGLSALGGVLGSIVTVAGAVGSAIAWIGTALAALLSPIGLVITATVALAAYLLYASGIAAQALNWLGERFEELRMFAADSFQGIADALAAGDIALAGRIVWLALKVAFEKGTGWLEGIWLRFKSFFVQTAYDAFYGALAAWEIIQNGLTIAWIETTAFLSQTWTKFTAGFTQAWNSAINWTTKRLLELWGLFDSELDVGAAKRMADEDLAATNAEIERQKQAALSEREQQRASQRQQSDQNHRSQMNRLSEDSTNQRRALRESNDARIRQSEAELEQARKELQDALGEAKQKRQMKESAGPPKPGRGPTIPDGFGDLGQRLAEARQRTIGVTGTFNALEARGLGAGGVADRIAKASEETARNTKKLLDELREMDGAAFE